MHHNPCFLRGQYVLCDALFHEHCCSFNSIIRLELNLSVTLVNDHITAFTVLHELFFAIHAKSYYPYTH